MGGGITRTFRPWTHTSDDSYIYQLSLVVATATVSFIGWRFFFVVLSYPERLHSICLPFFWRFVFLFQCLWPQNLRTRSSWWRREAWDAIYSRWREKKRKSEHRRVGFARIVRRYSPPISFIVSFINFLVVGYDNDSYLSLSFSTFLGGLSYHNGICFDIEN